MKSVFSEHGMPEELITDNGSCYTSDEFTTFMTQYGINHTQTSSHYHESNGLAEK